MANILILNGPNLNLLGSREPDIYGELTLADIDKQVQFFAKELGHTITSEQYNAEGELIEAIHNTLQNDTDVIIINPAALGSTSLALRDALLAVDVPFIEVHLSNIYQREQFRQHSYLSDIALGCICGFGPQVYELAIMAADSFFYEDEDEEEEE